MTYLEERSHPPILPGIERITLRGPNLKDQPKGLTFRRHSKNSGLGWPRRMSTEPIGKLEKQVKDLQFENGLKFATDEGEK